MKLHGTGSPGLSPKVDHDFGLLKYQPTWSLQAEIRIIIVYFQVSCFVGLQCNNII